MTKIYAHSMECQDCGQIVEIGARHTFVDCCLYTVDNLDGGALSPNRARAMAAEIRELRGRVSGSLGSGEKP